MVKRLIAAAALLAAGPLAAQTAPVPTAEAEALGRRVADSGTFASLFPMLIARDTEELVGQHPELDDADKARLRAVTAATARTALDRLLGAIGHEYALRLSVADLKAVVAFNQSPAARAWRRRAASDRRDDEVDRRLRPQEGILDCILPEPRRDVPSAVAGGRAEIAPKGVR